MEINTENPVLAGSRQFDEDLLNHLKKIPGFPIGEDADVTALSQPPFYTACPNPFIKEFLAKFGLPYQLATDAFNRAPFEGNLEVHSRHPVFSAHPYHTKVPPEIIRTLIEHYCVENGTVLDGFSGSGMAGVAALDAGRNAILLDLSPAATFISGVNTASFGETALSRELEEVLSRVEEQLEWMYETRDRAGCTAKINYTVWSDVFRCPGCSKEFTFFPHAVLQLQGKVETRKEFPCPFCSLNLTVRKIERVIGSGTKKKELVWVYRFTNLGKHQSAPTQFDLELISKIEALPVPAWYPIDPVDLDGYSARLAQLGPKTVTSVDRFLSKRNLFIFSALVADVKENVCTTLQNPCLYALTGLLTVISERQGYFGGGGGMSGNLYMPIVRMERNIFRCLRRRLKKLQKAEEHKARYKTRAIVSTQSSHCLKQIPDNSIDYIYTDPPFGANIIYSEVNLVLESWLKIKTCDRVEIVVNTQKRAGLNHFQNLLFLALGELYRVLKPDRWITIEFHNTDPKIWNLLREAMETAGFKVGQVSFLDKGSTTILQDIRKGAVHQDLLISAVKPGKVCFNEKVECCPADYGFWNFMADYLKIHPSKEAKGQSGSEIHHLYNQMVAYHFKHGLSLSLTPVEFYLAFQAHFKEFDSISFPPTQGKAIN